MIADPISGRQVRTDVWGRYLECRWCGGEIIPHEHAGRPRVQCKACERAGGDLWRRKLRREAQRSLGRAS